MLKHTTILGKTHQYESRINTEQDVTRREIYYKGDFLGIVSCRNQQRNGYQVENRTDLEIGHSQSALAQILITEYLLKKYMAKVCDLVKKAQTQTYGEPDGNNA